MIKRASSYLAAFLLMTLPHSAQQPAQPAFEVRWTPDVPPVPGVLAGAPETAQAYDPGEPSFTTALREQLGLRLENRRDSVDVLVIDRIEHPTED